MMTSSETAGAALTDRENAANATPIEELDPAQDALFAADTLWPLFDRLRDDDPVHFTPG